MLATARPEIIGPISLAGSLAGPTRRASTAVPNLAVNVGATVWWT